MAPTSPVNTWRHPQVVGTQPSSTREAQVQTKLFSKQKNTRKNAQATFTVTMFNVASASSK